MEFKTDVVYILKTQKKNGLQDVEYNYVGKLFQAVDSEKYTSVVSDDVGNVILCGDNILKLFSAEGLYYPMEPKPVKRYQMLFRKEGGLCWGLSANKYESIDEFLETSPHRNGYEVKMLLIDND